MKCIDFGKRLTEDLSHAKEEGLAAHLRSCEACRRLYDDLKALDELKNAHRQPVEAPPDFAGHVLREIDRAVARRRRLTVAAAALVMGISLGSWWYWLGLGAVETSQSTSLQPAQAQPLHPTPDVIISLEPEFKGIRSAAPGSPVDLGDIPAAIEIRNTRLHRDLYLKNVSH